MFVVRFNPLTNLFAHGLCVYSMPREYLLLISALNAANDSWVMYLDASRMIDITSSGRNACRGLDFGTLGVFTSSCLTAAAAGAKPVTTLQA